MPYSCKLGINKINIQAHADDIVALSPTSTGLLNILHRLQDFSTQHELLINVDQTKIICFKRIRNTSENRDNTFNNDSPIKQEMKYKYLV